MRNQAGSRGPDPVCEFLLSFFPKLCLPPAIPTQYEGRTRRHEREAGCGGRGWCRETSGNLSRTAKPCGPGAPRLASSLQVTSLQATEAIKPGLRGEHGISRKTSRRECRRKRLTCGDLLVCFFHSHTRLRARLAPGIPCALFLSRVMSGKTRTQSRRGNAESHQYCCDPSGLAV